MDKERNLGVTEARFALTILTCLLVAIGYIALLATRWNERSDGGYQPRRRFAAEHCRSDNAADEA